MLSPATHAAALAHARRLTNDHSEAILLPLVDAYETGYTASAQYCPTPDPNYLDLPALHARLLPLAQAAGHAQLLLSVEVGHELPIYTADATGGPSGFRRYIGPLEHGDTPSQFERRLTELLQQQAQYLATTQLRHAA